jgi:S1-C subfamily serine protease
MKTSLTVAVVVVVAVLFASVPPTQAPAAEPLHKAPALDKSKQKGWLGVAVDDAKAGVRVKSVAEDSPAEEAGIKEDDVIIEFNNKAVSDPADLVAEVRKTTPGETVNVVVTREKQKKTLQVKIGRLDSFDHQLAFTIPDISVPHVQRDFRLSSGFGGNEPLGLRLMDLNAQLGEYFGAPAGRGVLVERVKGKSAAARAGLKAGDVILKIGQDEVEGTGDVLEAMEDYEKGDTITVQVLRKGASMTFAVMAPGNENGGNLFYHYKLRKPVEESHLQWFDQDKLRNDMQVLKQELKSLGREMKTRMQDVRHKLQLDIRQHLQQELRQVGA